MDTFPAHVNGSFDIMWSLMTFPFNIARIYMSFSEILNKEKINSKVATFLFFSFKQKDKTNQCDDKRIKQINAMTKG
mgnify:CR=1 FL=1